MSTIPALMGGRKLTHSLDFDSSAAASALLRFGVQTIDMADAQVTLVTKQTSTTGEVQLSGQILVLDATSSGTSEIMLLPPEADCKGLVLIAHNNGGEEILIKEDAGSVTIVTIDTGESALLWCDGSATTAYGAAHVGWTSVLFDAHID